MVSVSRRTSSIGADSSLEMHSSQNDNSRFFIRKAAILSSRTILLISATSSGAIRWARRSITHDPPLCWVAHGLSQQNAGLVDGLN
jgi:hypothetical protein